MSSHPELRVALGGLMVLGVALLACKKEEAPAGQGPLSQPLTAEAAPVVEIPAVARFSVEAGDASNGVWTPGFGAERPAGSAEKNYLEAAQSCQSQGLQLCTETQYLKACAANSAVASHSAWTATWTDGSNAVTRGGDGGCQSRAVTPANSRDKQRVALCCERAIGIRTGNKNASFMKASHADLISYEKDFNGKSANLLSRHWGDTVSIDGTPLNKTKVDATQAAWFASHADQWTLYDVCDLSIGEVYLPGGKDKGLVAKCTTVTAMGTREVSVLTTFFGRFRGETDTRNRIVEMNHSDRLRKLSPL